MSTRKTFSACTCGALRMAARRLSQAYDAALAPEGLRISQFSILSALASWGQDLPTMQALADRLSLDRTTLGHNLQPLERDGLVVVENDPKDRRVRRIRLTEAGSAKRLACLPHWRAAQNRFDAAFGRDEAERLRQALLLIAHGPDIATQDSASETRAHVG